MKIRPSKFYKVSDDLRDDLGCDWNEALSNPFKERQEYKTESQAGKISAGSYRHRSSGH